MSTGSGIGRVRGKAVDRPHRRSTGIRTAGLILRGGLLMLAIAPGTVHAQGLALRGELLHRNGEPAREVRLAVVGHPPEVVVRDGGLFTHPLSGEPSEVTVRVLDRPGTEVLFPPEGRVVVPRDPDAVVSVVVGERIGEAVENRIEQDLRALRETLEVRGVSETVIEEVVRREMDGLVTRIAELTEGAVDEAVQGAARTTIRDRISRHLGTYVRTSRDLLDAFALIEVSGRMSQSQFLALYQAMGAYSEAYAELDRELGTTTDEVRRAWPGDPGIERSDALARTLTLIHEELHRQVLDLRQPLLVIQAEFTDGNPSAAELAAARSRIEDTLAPLESHLERLDSNFALLLETLRAPTRP